MRTIITLLLSLAPFLAVSQEAVSVKIKEGNLHGTLEAPAGATTAVLILPGSGPTDRNGNNPAGIQSNGYQLLAEALAQEGIASLRFDKRGVAESAAVQTPEADLRLETYVQDARLWLNTLQQRYSKVVILGHSEGALIGTLLAQQVPPSGLIALQGAGLPADSILKQQLSKQNPLALGMVSPYLDSLKQGYTVKAPASLNMLFRPSVQPYLISWFAYEPAAELAKISCPVLVVGGTSDIQVPAEQAQLLAQQNPQAQLTIIKELTHTLKQAPEGDLAKNMETYSQPDFPLHPELMPALLAFIEKL